MQIRIKLDLEYAKKISLFYTDCNTNIQNTKNHNILIFVQFQLYIRYIFV